MPQQRGAEQRPSRPSRPLRRSAGRATNLASLLAGAVVAGAMLVALALAAAPDAEAKPSSGTTFYAYALPTYSSTATQFAYANAGSSSSTVTLHSCASNSVVATTTVGAGTSAVPPVTSTPAGGSRIASTQLYRITSTAPVGAAQLAPDTATTDGSQLLPVADWGMDYVVGTYAGLFQGHLVVVASQTASVTVTPTTSTLAGGGLPAMTAGTPTTFTLNACQAAQIEATSTTGDFTGSRVTSSAPVGVFASAPCVYVPATNAACDHVQEMLWPRSDWATSYVVCRSPVRGSEPDLLRFVSLNPGSTTVTVNGINHAIASQYAFVDVEVFTDAYVTSTQPVVAMQLLEGAVIAGVSQGDPAMSQVAPTGAFGAKQSFHTWGGSWSSTFAMVAAPSAASLTIDGSPLTGTAVGTSGYKCARATGLATGYHTVSGGGAGIGVQHGAYGHYDSYLAPAFGDCPVPGASTLSLSGTPTSSSVPLGWTTAAGCNLTYTLQRDASSSFPAPTTLYTGTATSHTDTPVSACTTYHYRVRASDGTTTGPWSATLTVTTPATGFGAPTLSPSGATTSSVSLSWTSVPACGTPQYTLQRSATSGFASPTTVYTGTGTSHTDTPLSACTTYYYRVRASDPVPPSTSAWSNTVTAQTYGNAPSAPTLSLGTVTPTSIALSWTTVTGCGGISYTLERSTSPTFSSPTTVYSGSAASHTDTPVSSCTAYHYRVKAVDAYASPASGPWSNAVSATTPHPSFGAPTLSSPSGTTSSIALSWTSVPACGTPQYTLQRSTTSGFASPTTVYTGTGTSHTDTPLSSCTTYYYRVHAADPVPPSTSAWSNTVSRQTAGTQPASPTLSLGTVTSTSIALSWTTVTGCGAVSYTLERSTSPSFTSPTTVYSGAATSHTNTPVSSCTTYHYRVKATDTLASPSASPWSNAVTATPPSGSFAAPTLSLAAPPTPSSTDLSWTASSGCGAIEYRLDRDVTPAFTSPMLAYLGPGTAFTDGPLAPCTTYYYHVRAYDPVPAVTSAWSNTVAAPTAGNAPGNPALSSPGATTSSIDLEWTVVTGCGGIMYELERDTDPAFTAPAFVYGGPATAFTDSPLPSCEPFHYRVRAIDASAMPSDGPWSNTVSTQTYGVPGAPPTLSNSPPTTSTVVLSWTPVAGCGSVDYRLERSTTPSFTSPTVIYSGPATTHTNGVTACNNFYYRVQAFDSMALPATAGWSNVLEVRTPGCPPPNFMWDASGCLTVEFLSVAPPGLPFVMLSWDWSDPPTPTVDTAAPWTATHTFTAEGTYAVTLTATYARGQPASRTYNVAVDACERTYAAAASMGDGAFILGDDPGCGLGGPDSSNPGHPRAVIHLNPTPTPQNIYLDQPMPLPTFLQAAGFTSDGAGGLPLLVAAGGAHDCTFTPANDVMIHKYDGSSNLVGNWAFGPDLNEARISPAYATVYQGGGVYVAGGDVTGGDPLDPANPHVPTASVEFLAPNPMLSWSQMERMPAGVVGAAGSYEPQCTWVGIYCVPSSPPGTFVVSGGFGHPQTPNAAVQVFDEATGKWQGPHLPDPNFVTGHRGEVCGAQRWVLGGMVGEKAPMHNVVPALVSDDVWRSGSVAPWPATSPWNAAGAMPEALAYAQTAVWDNRIFVYGGYDAAGGVSNAYFFMECPAAGAPSFTALPNPLRPALAEAAMEASTAALYVFGGTSSVASGPGGLLGDCPTDVISALAPLTGAPVALPLPTLPAPTASMGSATLPDGRIALVGGRVQAGATCHAPTDQVLVFDPVTLTLCTGPTLPVPLIGPAVSVVGTTLFVAGGDDRGDVPSPSGPADPRPRHPHARMYAIGTAGLCPATGSWTDLGAMPMGVVHGQMLPLGSGLWIVGGNQHPSTAVRMVQPFDTASMAWQHPMMPEARAHHAMVLCLNPAMAEYVYGGLTDGSTLYLSLSGSTVFKDDVIRQFSPTGWGVAGTPGDRAFAAPIPPSAYPGHFADGTTPASHRTLHFEGLPGC